MSRVAPRRPFRDVPALRDEVRPEPASPRDGALREVLDRGKGPSGIFPEHQVMHGPEGLIQFICAIPLRATSTFSSDIAYSDSPAASRASRTLR